MIPKILRANTKAQCATHAHAKLELLAEGSASSPPLSIGQNMSADERLQTHSENICSDCASVVSCNIFPGDSTHSRPSLDNSSDSFNEESRRQGPHDGTSPALTKPEKLFQAQSSKTFENAEGTFSVPGKGILLGTLKTIASWTLGKGPRQKPPNPSSIGYEKSDVVITSTMTNEVEDIFLSKVVTWSRNHFRHVPCSKLREATSLWDVPELVLSGDVENVGSIPRSLREAVGEISWNLDELLHSPQLSSALLMQGIVSNILSKHVILQPFRGYKGDDAIECRIDSLRKEIPNDPPATECEDLNCDCSILVSRINKEIAAARVSFLEIVRNKNLGNQTHNNLKGRSHYLEEVVAKVDALIAPIAKLNKGYSENSDSERITALLGIAESADYLSYFWGARLFDVTPIDKSWIERKIEKENRPRLYRINDDGIAIESAIQYHESKRLDQSEVPGRAWPILAVMNVGFMKYEVGDGTSADLNPGEVWAKAGLLLGEEAIVTESDERKPLETSNTAAENKILTGNQVECAT